MILYDQRGTGEAQPSLVVQERLELPLDESLTSPKSRAALLSAIRALTIAMRGRGVDLSAYNTSESAEDLEDLRKALGVGKWTVWGHSYGSHLALAYLRLHESAVERVILSGVNGLDQRRRLPLDGDALFANLTTLVRTTPKLARLVPDVARMTQRVLDRLAKAPVMVDVDSVKVFVGKEELQTLIAIQSGDRDFIEALPMIVGRLDAGHYDTVARQIVSVIKRRSLGTAMTYAMDVASGVSATRARQIREETPRALLGNAINWPLGDDDVISAVGVQILPDTFRAPVRSATPTLFISGTLDGRTSIRDAENVRAGFRNSGHIIIHGASHTPYRLSAELRDRIVAFARGQSPSSARLQVSPMLRGPDEAAMIEELQRVVLQQGADAAVSRMRQLATDSTHHFTPHVFEGLVLALRREQPELAMALLETGPSFFPANSSILTRLGQVALARGDSGSAARYFSRAFEVDPLNETARVQLTKIGLASH